MFEREIKFIYDFNINQVKQLGAFFTFSSLSSLNIHPAILNYISAEIDYLIFEDRRKMLENSNFDYSSQQITQYFNLINQEIKKEKKLSFEYISNLILHAVSFTVNYLAQPKWSLSKLIFTKDYVMNVNDVKQILNYLYYYNYNKNILDSYLRKKKIISISKTELEQIIDKISAEIFAAQSTKMIDNALYAMAEYFNIGSLDKNKIPLLAIELFLKEKGLTEYFERLESISSVESKPKYIITELRKILYNPVPLKKGAYLDRILKQEKPAVIFKHDETEEQTPEILKHKEPAVDQPVDEIKQAEPKEKDSTIQEMEDPYEVSVRIIVERERIDNPEVIPSTYIEHDENIPAAEDKTNELKVKLSSVTENINTGETESLESLLDTKEELKVDFKEIEKTAESENIQENDFVAEEAFSDTNNETPLDLKKEIDPHLDLTEGVELSTPHNIDTPVKDKDSVIVKIDEEIKILESKSDFQLDETGKDDGIIVDSLFEDFKDNDLEFQLADDEPDSNKSDSPSDNLYAQTNNSDFNSVLLERDGAGEISDFSDDKDKRSLVDFMNRRQTRKILSAIFNGDTDDFNNTIDSIEKCSNYSEAISILESLYRSYHIKPTLKEAVLLRNVVLEYYTR